jgi:TRAP-type uncharacterized transport system substrate-binding protein
MRPVLRRLLLLSMLIAAVGIGYAVWKAVFNRTTTFRMAVTSLDGRDARLAGALNRWMVARNSRYRLRPELFANHDEAMKAVSTRKADLAVARADQPWPADVASALVMYRTKLLLLGNARAGVTSLAQLPGRTIGLIGGLAPDDPLLATFLRLHNVSQPRLAVLADAEIAQALGRNTVQVLAMAGPLSGGGSGFDDLARLLRSPAAKGLTLLGLADGEATAAQDRRYDSSDLAPGRLRAQPALPEETESVMAVAHHLVLRRAVPSVFVSRFVAEIVDAKRGILATTPLAGQIDAPDEEVNAAAPVHPGASAYFNDEEVTLAELVSEWGYLVLVVLGGLASGFIWLIHRLWPHQARTPGARLIADFLALRRQAAHGEAGADLRARFEDVMQRMETALQSGDLAEEDAPPVMAAATMAERALASRT